MNNTEQFEKLTLEEMLEAVTAKLEQAKEAAKKEASVRLEELNAKKDALQIERRRLLVKAAFEHVSSIKQEDINASVIYSDYLGSGKATLTMSVRLPEPEELTKLEEQISEINGEIGRVKNQAALDLDQEASSAKELALIYLARRMKKDSPKWDEPKHAVPPMMITRGPLT